MNFDPWGRGPDTSHVPTYRQLLLDAATNGRCPVWIAGPGRTDPPDDPASALTDLETRDVSQILAGGWPGGCPCCDERLDPFRDGFPGLLPRPAVDTDVAIWHAARVADDQPFLGEPTLVAASRPADVPAVIGWMGSYNSWQDTVGMSAVLRSWEERFGALLYCVNASTLELAVAAPPRTGEECLRVAAEHIAFCIDAFDTYTGQITTDTLREYARRLRDAPEWRFWWD
jgi:hypothetical protein